MIDLAQHSAGLPEYAPDYHIDVVTEPSVSRALGNGHEGTLVALPPMKPPTAEHSEPLKEEQGVTRPNMLELILAALDPRSQPIELNDLERPLL